MEEQKLEDLYQFVPKGMFSNKEELQSFINTDGLNSVYQLIPNGMFSDENSFVSAFASQKKKPSSAGEKVGTMGSTGQPTQEKDILSELQFDKETYTPIKSKLPAPTKGTGLVGEDAPKGYVETPPAPKIQPTKPVAPTTDMPDYGKQYRDISDEKVAIKQLQIKRAEDILALDTKDAKDLGFSLDEYRQLNIKKYAVEFLTGPQQNQYNIENRINSLTELTKGLDPVKDINSPLFKSIEKLQREKDASKQEMVNGVLSRVDQLKSELPGLTGDAKREKAEEIKKLYASIAPVIAPAAYAKEKADTPEVRTMPGDTPMEKLKNYYSSITNEYEETLKLYQKESYILSGIKAYTDPSQTRKLARLEQEIKELTPIVTINQKELKEDNWLSQLAKGAIGTLIDSDIITTEQEQATKLYDSFKKADISSNISKENIAALNESMRMTTGEEVSSTLGVTLGMMPSFMGGGMAVKGVGKLSKLTKGGTRAAGAFDNLSKSSKAAKFLLGATETGLSYEAAGLLSSSQSVEDEASFISGFMGETFVGALGKLVPKKLYNQTMLKLFGGSANKAQDIFMKGLAQVGSKAGYGFGEVAEEYGNEIGNIISESNGDLNEFMKLHSERFGKFDDNVKFGLMTFGMGMAFGAFTKSGKQFMEKHQEWLSEQSPEVQSEFATIAAETQAAIEPIEKIAELEAEAETIVDEESPRLQEIEAEIAQIEALTDEDKALEAALAEEGTLPDLAKETVAEETAPQATEKVDALKDVESTTKGLESLPLEEIDMPLSPLDLDNEGINTWKKNNPQSIAEAYHRAKAEDNNPELVNAVENLLGTPTAQIQEETTPQATEEVADVADVAKKAAKPTLKTTDKKAPKEVKAATLEIEDRRKKELSERVVYDKAPTAEDGEFKLAGVPGDTIFRINKETGKPQTLNKTTGNFTNVTTPAKVFFDGTKKSGFEKTKESINARYDAEITALTTPATTEVATEAKVQEETKPATPKVPTLKGSALFNAARSIKADAKKSIENTASDLEKISEYLKQIYQEYKAADTEYKKTRIRNIQKEVTLQKEAISKDLNSKKEAKIKEEKAKIEKSLQSKRDTRMEVADDKESKAKVDKLFSETDKTVSEKLSGNLVRNKSGNTRTSLDSKKIIEFAKKAAKSISKILPNTNIVLHDSSAEYNKYKTGNSKSVGEYNPNTNTIHIDLSTATKKTLGHEIFHAIILSNISSDKKLQEATKNMYESVVRLLGDNTVLKNRLEEFSNRYDNDLKNEEAIAELTGILAAEFESLDAPIKTIIKKWINDIANAFGISNIIGISSQDMSDLDVYNMLNAISSRIAIGTELTNDDISMLSAESSLINAKKPGTRIVTESEEVLFKGMQPKTKDGKLFSVHKIKQGSFAALDIKLAMDYKGDKPLKKFTIPSGTTVDVVKLAPEDSRKAMSIAREIETASIDASSAQVVKLLTYDARGGVSEQYIIKDKSILSTSEDLNDTETIDAATREEIVPDGKLENVISSARKKGFDDSNIIRVLKSRGFSEADIMAAMAVTIDKAAIPSTFLSLDVQGAVDNDARIKAGIDMYMRLMNKVNSLIQAGDSYSKIKAAIVSELNQDATFKNETQEKQFDLIKAATALVNTAVYFDRAERAYTIDEKVKNREKTVGGLKDLKLSIVNIIKASIPKNSTKSKSLIEKLSKQVNSYTESNVEAKSKKLIDDIVKAREAIMKDVVSKITSTIQSSTDESIKAMQPLLKLALDGNMNKIEELVEGLSDKIGDIKKKRYAELKKSEKALLGLDYAFANISNITSMSLEEAISLFDNLKGLNSNKIYKINSVRDFNNFIKNKINEDSQSQIAETNPELFDANGVPLNSDEINLTKMESVRQRFKDAGIGEALMQLKTKIKSSSLGSLMKQGMDWRNLDTIVNILDRVTRGKDFFDRMVARPLKRANTEKLRGEQSTLDIIDKIAKESGFESFDEFERKTKRGEVKGIKVKKGTAGETITANISYERAQRIYALSLNTVQREKILKVISEAELKKIEDALSENERVFIKGILEFLSNEYYKSIDSVKYATEGVHLGFIEMYFPTSTMSEAASEMGIEQAYSTGEIKLMESKYHKARTDKKSTIQIFDEKVKDGFSEILRDYIDKMEHYKSYAYTTIEIHHAINAPASKALIHAIGVAEPLRSKINFAINGSQAAYSKNQISEFLQSRLADIVLSWKPIQYVKQASSIFGAFSKFNISKKGKRIPGSTIKDLFEFGYKAGWYGMQASLEMAGIPVKNGPVARAREMSPDFRIRYDRHKSGQAYIRALESGGQVIKKKRIDKTRWQRFLSNVIKSKKFFLAAGDIVGVIGYMVNYDKDLENNVPMSKAQEDFADYNATQQSDRGVDMIGMQQKSNWATKIFTQFLSTSFLYMNNFARSSRNIRKDLIESVALSFNGKFKESYKARPKKEDIRGFVLYGGLLNALFQVISYFSKLISDDEDDVKDAQKHILEGATGLSLVYAFPIVGALTEQLDLAGRAIAAAHGDDYVEQRKSANLGVNPIQRFWSLLADFNEKETKEQAKTSVRIFVQLGTGTPTAQFETVYNIYENHGYVEPEDTYELMGISKSYRPKEAKPESEYEEKKTNLLFLGERKYKEMYGEDDDLKQFKKEEKELLE
jgi:hypothetical protein